MIRRPPRSTRTDTLFPYTTLFRSQLRIYLEVQTPTMHLRIGCTPHIEHWDSDSIRSEEHTSELQSLMRISYAVFCLKKKTSTIKSIPAKHTLTCTQNSNTIRSTMISTLITKINIHTSDYPTI